MGRVVLTLAMTALPVALWILSSISNKPIEFDYPEFLHYYFEKHFFLSASSPIQIVALLLIMLTGGAALKVLHLGVRASAVFVGLLVVFAIGVVVGATSHSPLMLNLHLIRVDGLILLMAATLTASAAIRKLDVTRPMQTLAGGALCVGLITKVWFTAPCILLALSLTDKGTRRPFVTRLARPLMRLGATLRPVWALAAQHPKFLASISCLAFIVHVAAAGVVQRARSSYTGGIPASNQLNGLPIPAPQWRGVATWAREHTDPGATFLVPLTINGFRVAARRQVWVDWKEGAAVMWAPELYRDWHSRVESVRRLQAPTALFEYACENRLDYLVIDKRDAAMRDPLPGILAAYSNDVFDAYAVIGCADADSGRVKPTG